LILNSFCPVVCDSTSVTNPDNGCNVVDGQLTLYTTDGQADGMTDSIEMTIRENMNNGQYASTNQDIVRLVYLDTVPSQPESNTEDGNTGNESNSSTDTNEKGTSSQLMVGLFVGIIGGAAIIAGVLYRTRRNRLIDDETDLQTANAPSAMQAQETNQLFNDAGGVSYEDSVRSYDESGMMMADTGMDSASSDGLGAAT
jgi:hypothetical protein